MNIKQLMASEAALITMMFKRNNIRARVDPKKSFLVATGYISYGLAMAAMDERFATVENYSGNSLPSLAMLGVKPAILVTCRRSCVIPRLALELPHPKPESLLASNAVLTSAPAHTMLCGRSYIDGPKMSL